MDNVKVFRCADLDSDHILLTSKIKLKLMRHITSYKHGKQYNVAYLRNYETKE